MRRYHQIHHASQVVYSGMELRCFSFSSIKAWFFAMTQATHVGFVHFVDLLVNFWSTTEGTRILNFQPVLVYTVDSVVRRNQLDITVLQVILGCVL